MDEILTDINKKFELYYNEFSKHETKEEKSKCITKLSKVLKFGFIIKDSLEQSIRENAVWNIEDAKISLLYITKICIKINNIAQSHYNKWLKMDDEIIQLNEYVKENEDIFGDLVIVK